MTARPTRTAPGQSHAIVLGGSMAGLLAARVLADHFTRVTLVERDKLPVHAAQRRGVPQGQHTHGLLAGGREVLDRLFPGFSGDMHALGAVPGDLLRDARWVFEGAPLARTRSGLDGFLVSRPTLEAAVRARVRALQNVTVRDASHAVAPLTAVDGDERRVTGVSLLTGECLQADLVVDATGRGSRADEWLQSLGYEAPAEERVEIGLSYTTRQFRRTPDHLSGDLSAIVPPTPTGKRGGVMVAQEGDRWTVTLIAHFVRGAGEDLDAFRSFAATLPSRDIYDVVRTAEPIGDAIRAKFPASVRRRYERLSRFPEGFVVIGDALCSFNPIYGQGMSVAALEAEALGRVLAESRSRIGPRFFRAAARVADTPWTTAVGNDLRMPETVGPRSTIGDLVNAYVARLHQAAQVDARLAVRFMRVANLKAHPGTLFAPTTVLRVVAGTVARTFRAWRALPGNATPEQAPAPRA